MELGPENISDICDLFLCELYAVFHHAENVAALLRWDRLFATFNEAFEHYGKELLERGLNSALDCETLRVHHLEAALHYEGHKLF